MKRILPLLMSMCLLACSTFIFAQGPCTIDFDPATPGTTTAADAGLSITDVDMSTNYFNASPITAPASTGGAASLTVNDGTEYCDENGNGMQTGSEEGPDLVIMIPVPPENALSCADGTLTICLRGDFNNACEVAFIANAAGEILSQSETTGNPACAGPPTCLDIIIPACDLNADAVDGMILFEIRTNGEAVSTGATGDQVDDTCTNGADAVDLSGDGNPDGNCMTFESFVWPTTVPEITCPADVTLECTDSTDPADTGEPTFTGECVDDASFTFEDVVEGTCPSVITRTWTATICNDPEVPFFELTCDQIITIEDTTPPTITCPEPADTPLLCGEVPMPGQAMATDNCTTFDTPIDGVPDLTPDQIDPCVGGVITYLFTAVDDCGLEAMCMQTFTYEPDTEDPVLSDMPANVDLVCGDPIPEVPMITATDNCTEPQEVVFEETTMGTCPEATVIMRTWTATDDCGNETTYTQNINIPPDATPPVLDNMPADLNLICTDAIPPADVVTATDDCIDPIEVTLEEVDDMGVCPDPRIITRTWTAMDACMNMATYTQTITVAPDVTPPMLSDMPADLNLTCADAIPPADPITATDDCTEPQDVVFEETDTGMCPEDRIITRTWTATDDCGNEATYTQTITIAPDTTPPVLSEEPADENLTCADAIPAAPAVTATDDCTDPQDVVFEETDDMGVCPDPRIITRTWTATDECMNETTYTQTITVAPDVTPPVLSEEPADITLVCGDPIPEVPAITATDDCTNPQEVVFEETTMGTCPEPTVILRTWTATDDCGNETTYTQTIDVPADDMPPVLSDMPADLDLICTDAIPPADPITATDDCTDPIVPVLVETDDMGICPDPRIITRTWTATDACMNEATYTQTITIAPDTTPPVLSEEPADENLTCADAIPPAATVTATDDCTDPQEVVFEEVDDAGVCPDPRIITRTWTATDDCGNETTYTQTITIAPDATPPVITCPPDDPTVYTLETDIPAAAADIAAFEGLGGTAMDDCGTMTLASADEVTPCPGAANQGEVVRTYTITDECGNFSTCTQTFLFSCCDAAAGALAPIADICIGESISTTVDGTEAPAPDYGYDYVLTDAAGAIIDGPNTTGMFTPTAAGEYCVHGVSYQIATGAPDYTSGDINTVTQPTDCIDTTSECFTVTDPPTVTIGECAAGPAPTNVYTGLEGTFPMDMLGVLPDIYVFCEPGCVEAAGAGGAAPYMYEWFELSDECAYDFGAPIANTPDASGLGTGTYSVVVTDASGCTATGEVKVFVDEPPMLTASADTTLCAGEAFDLEGTSLPGPGICLEYCEGELPVCIIDDNTVFTVCFDFQYSWISDLNLILEAPDGTQLVLVSSEAYPNNDMDGNMCFTNDANAGNGVLAGGALDALDWNNYPAGTADAAGLGIGVSGNWFPEGGQGAFGVFNGLDANSGTWQVIILDDLPGLEGFFNSFTLDIVNPDCEYSVEVDINMPIIDFVPTTIMTEPIECEELPNCTATYQWTGSDGFDSGVQTITPQTDILETFPLTNITPPPGTTTYTLTVTDCFGCVSTEEVVITVADEIMAEAASPECGQLDITSIAGGTPDYTVTIGLNPDASDALATATITDASATPEFMDLAEGDYFIAIEDANGCTALIGPITVEACFSCDDFMADIFGCNMPIDSFIVDGNYPDGTVAPLPEVFVYCEGDLGCLDATPIGGTAPYTYEWFELTDNCDYTDPAIGTTANLSDLETGTYQVVITDANGCEATFEAKIFIDMDPTVNLNNGGDTEVWICNGNTFDIIADALPGPDFCKEYCGGELPMCPIDAASIITVCMEFDHTYISDLSFELVAPDGTVIPLVMGQCCPNGADDADQFCFTNDTGSGAVSLDWNTTGAAGTDLLGLGTGISGTWLPETGVGAFNSLVGVDANGGPWAMIVTDIIGGDFGTFNNFEVTITGGTCETVFSSPDFDADIPDNQQSFTYETPVLECFNIENIIAEYQWVCSDGTDTGVVTATNNEIPDLTFTATAAGQYTCTLEVWDLWGCSTTTDFIINVPEEIVAETVEDCDGNVTVTAMGGYAGANAADFTFTISPDPTGIGAIDDPAQAVFSGLTCGDTYEITINDNTPVSAGGATFDSGTIDTAINGQTCVDIPVSGFTTVLGMPNGAILDIACIDVVAAFGVEFFDATLTSPAGTVVDLMTQFGGQTGPDAEPCYQDGQPGIAIGTPPYAGGFSTASGALADFNGEDPNGTWTLCVTDGAGAGGTIEDWSLGFTSEPCLATIEVTGPCPIEVMAASAECETLDITSLTGGTPDYMVTIGMMPDASDALAMATLTDASAMNEFMGLMPGAYYVAVTDANGCTSTVGPITVTDCDSNCGDFMVDVGPCADFPPNEIYEDLEGLYPMDMLGILPDVYVFCEPGCVSGVPMGGTAPLMYEWFELSDECDYDFNAPIANTQDASGLGSGVYAVVVTDANGCTASQEVKVFVNTPPELTTSGNMEVCAGDTFDLEGNSLPTAGFCLEYCEGDLPVCIVDDNTIFTVCFDFQYSWISDLNLILEAPDGTQLVLVSSEAYPNNDMDGNMCFTNDANAGNGVLPGGALDALDWNTYPAGTADAAGLGIGISGNWFPEGGQGAFSAFNGVDANSGVWQVIILDDLPGLEGFFNSFTLDIINPDCSYSVAVDINMPIIDFVPTTIVTEPIECEDLENCTASYQWTGSDGFDSGVIPIANQQNQLETLPPVPVTATGDATYILTVTDCFGCVAMDTVMIMGCDTTGMACTMVMPVMEITNLCSGNTVNLTAAETNVLAGVADPAQITGVVNWYTDAALTMAYTVGPINHSGATCDTEVTTLYAEVVCNDGTTIPAGQIDITVYPFAEVMPPMDGSCVVAVAVPDCPNLTLSGPTNPTGGADLGNWDAATGTYTGQNGDMAGTLDFMITGGTAPCDMGTLTVDIPACNTDSTACTGVAGIMEMLDLCSGSTPDLTGTEANVLAGIADPTQITGVVNFYTDAALSMAYTGSPINHSGATCDPEVTTLYPEVVCNDGTTIPAGQIDITVYPFVEVIPPMDGSCVLVVDVPNCPNLTLSGPTNPTGGADLANWDAATNTYTGQNGELAGTLDFVVTGVTAPCSAGTITVNIPECNDDSTGTGFDLALIKTLSPGQAGTVAPGDNVSFDITVTNQGTIDGFNVLVNDYVPAGYTFDPALNPAWADADGDGNPDQTLAGPIAANGGTQTITIILTVNDPFVGSMADLVNYAEISAADDDMDPNNTPPTDDDSTPNNNPNDDAGGTPDGPDDDYIDGDGTGTPNDSNDATDEDDQDPAYVDVVDPNDCTTLDVAMETLESCGGESPDVAAIEAAILGSVGDPALVMNAVNWYFDSGLTMPYTVGGPINHSDTDAAGTCDPGTVTLYGEVVCNDGESINAGTITITVYPFAEVTPPADGSCETVVMASNCPNLMIGAASNATGGADLANWDAATNTYTGQDGDAAGTIDVAVSGGTAPCDAGTITITIPECMGDGMGDDCTTLDMAMEMIESCGGEAPDVAAIEAAILGSVADPTLVMNAVNWYFDLGLTMPYTVGGPINHSDSDAAGTCDPGTVTLYGEVVCNDGASINAGTITVTVYPFAEVTPPGDGSCVTTVAAADCPNLTIGAASNPTGGVDLANWDAATGTYTGILNDAAGTIDIEITGGTDPCASGTITINIPACTDDGTGGSGFDLALIKTLSSGQAAVVAPGDNVSFDITVTNQGIVDGFSVLVNDYVPAGYTFDPALNPAWGDADGDGNPDQTIAGPIAANGGTQTITIVLTVVNPFNGTMADLVNVAEISAADDDTDPNNTSPTDDDSTADNNPNDDAGGTPGGPDDDYIDGDGTGTPDDNTPGTDEDDQDPAFVIVDDGLADDCTTLAAALESLTLCGGIAPDIAAIEAAILGSVGDPSLVTSAVNWYFDNGLTMPYTVGGPINHSDSDAAGTCDPGTVTLYGEVVCLDGASINAGTITVTVYPFAEVTPPGDGSCVTTVAASNCPNLTIGAASNPTGGVSLANWDVATNTYTGVLGDAAGTIDIAVSGGTAPCDAGTITVNIPACTDDGTGGSGFDLALIKTLSSGQAAVVAPGDNVSFDITVTNQGIIDGFNVLVNDYVPAGYTFDPALNSAWADADGDGNPDQTIAGPIAANGGTQTITIILTVVNPFNGTAADLVNVAEISEADDDMDPNNTPPTDDDSTADNNPNDDAGGTPGGPDDDYIDGDGTGTPDDNTPSTDEDDQDPAVVIVDDGLADDCTTLAAALESLTLCGGIAPDVAAIEAAILGSVGDPSLVTSAVNWYFDNGLTMPYTAGGPINHSDSDAAGTCDPGTVTLYGEVVCLDGASINAGTITITVYPFAEVQPGNGCEIAVSAPNCPNLMIGAASNATGGASLANWDAATNTYTGALGDAAGTIDVAVSGGTAPCDAGTITINIPECTDGGNGGDDCTTLDMAMEMIESCGGAAPDVAAIEAAILASVGDPSLVTSAVNWYFDSGLTMPYTAGGPINHSDSDAAGTCDPGTVTLYGEVVCLDGASINAGTITITVYPFAEVQPGNGCEIAVSAPNCPNLTIGAASNATGGASLANWDAATNTYTGVFGDAAGTIDVAVSGGTDPCAAGTITINIPECTDDGNGGDACTSTTEPTATLEVCGGLTPDLSSAEATILAGIGDVSLITGDVIWYTDAGLTTQYNGGDIDHDDSTAAGTCDAGIVTLYAQVICGDGERFAAGMVNITVYPFAPNIAPAGPGCMLVVTPACPGDVIGVASNATGGASLDNWDPNTGVYTAFEGDFAGSIDLEITSANTPCGTMIYTLEIPRCGAPDEVPTVGEWGLIILGLLMSIIAVVGIRQRRKEEEYHIS